MIRPVVTLVQAWPRMLRLAEAAAYCGRSPSHLRLECPIPPTRFSNGDMRWDRHLLDQWLDNLQHAPSGPTDEEIVSRLR
jgi:hypothetical protein